MNRPLVLVHLRLLQALTLREPQNCFESIDERLILKKIRFTYPDLLGDRDLERETDLLLLRALVLEPLDLAEWFEPTSEPSSEKLLFSESDILVMRYTLNKTRVKYVNIKF